MPVRVPRILSAVKEGRGTREQNVNSHSRGRLCHRDPHRFCGTAALGCVISVWHICRRSLPRFQIEDLRHSVSFGVKTHILRLDTDGPCFAVISVKNAPYRSVCRLCALLLFCRGAAASPGTDS
jgi:hypothetical protein